MPCSVLCEIVCPLYICYVVVLQLVLKLGYIYLEVGTYLCALSNFKFTPHLVPVPMFPEAAKMKDTTQVSHRMMVRKRMNCNNFKWFLDNIWPEHFFPDNDRFFGKVRALHECVLTSLLAIL